jgi:type IV pilus assembly protein PilQ
VVVDIMGATSKLAGTRFESKFYPVTAVTAEPSEATGGLRVTVRLRDLVEHTVTTENGLVVIDLGVQPIAAVMPAEEKDLFAGKKLTLYVKDADLTDILRMIASQFNLNILVSQDVKSMITVRLADVPLRTAVDALLRAGLCNMVEDAGGVIVVKPVKKEMYGETKMRVFELDYVEADDLQKVVTKALSPAGSSEITFRRIGTGSTRSSMLVVYDIPEALDRVAQVIADFDRPVPQIAIEAKFIETTLTADDRYGIEWQIQASASSGSFDFTKDFGVPLTYNNFVLGKVELNGLKAQLELLQSRGLSRVLASPRTVTLDNQKAVMNVSTDIPQRQVSSDPKTGLVIATWSTRSVPTKLEVTPHATADGRVAMILNPTVEAITGYTGSADDQRPIVSSRGASTQVVVGDGEAAVIGGLIRDEEVRNVGKVPLLGDIPIIGHLFKKTSVRHNKTDLMIIVIPHIIPVGR